MSSNCNQNQFSDLNRNEELRIVDKEKGCCEVFCPWLCRRDPPKPIKILLLVTGGSGMKILKNIMYKKNL